MLKTVEIKSAALAVKLSKAPPADKPGLRLLFAKQIVEDARRAARAEE